MWHPGGDPGTKDSKENQINYGLRLILIMHYYCKLKQCIIQIKILTGKEV